MSNQNLRKRLEKLYQEVLELRKDVFEEGSTLYQKWEESIEREEFLESAQNLAYYLALRRRDIRGLQEKLSQWGLSSLGRLEAKVLPQIDSVLLVMAKLLDKSTTDLGKVNAEEMEKMRYDYLQQNASDVLGPKAKERYTRIMVTMPPIAGKNSDFIVALLEKGMQIARINCSQDDTDTWMEMVKNIRKAEEKTNKKCLIYFDIAGPKVRVDGLYTNEKNPRLKKGDTFFITAEEGLKAFHDQSLVLGCKNKDILDQLVKGDTVALDDGIVSGHVVKVTPEGAVVKVDKANKKKGVKVKAQKGINFPNTTVKIPLITKKDQEDLEAVKDHADILGFSFVKDAEDIASLQKALFDSLGEEKAKEIPLIVKIETLQSIDHLIDIIITSAGKNKFGIMIARGDLAVEAGFIRLSELQEEILWICEAAHIPVIWATQVLETMVKEGIPTRAEITDATMSARSECVMLNKGDYLEEAVALLDEVLVHAQAHQYKKSSKLRALGIAEKAWSAKKK